MITSASQRPAPHEAKIYALECNINGDRAETPTTNKKGEFEAPLKIRNCDDQVPPHATDGVAQLPPTEENKGKSIIIRSKEIKKTVLEPYCEICMFDHSGNICLLNKETFTVSISVSLSSLKIRPVHCIIDTVMEPNLVRDGFLDNKWLQAIRAVSAPSLKSVNCQMISVVGTLLLHIRVVDAHIQVAFGVVRTLPVPILLENFLIDRCV